MPGFTCSPTGDLFSGPTVEVARRLIGCTLVRRTRGDNGAEEIVAGRIVETEAYLPLVDPSCHGYRGPTKRNANMFGRAGHAYVYFIYGNHYCLNVVTEAPGIGAAVLIRAVEPIAGVETMRRNRPGTIPEAALASGPGNLCRAFGIDRSFDGVNLREGDLRIEEGRADKSARLHLRTTPRIGLSQAVTWPLRFIDSNSPSVSPYRVRR